MVMYHQLKSRDATFKVIMTCGKVSLAKMLRSLGNHDTWCFLIDLRHFSVLVGRL